MKKILLMISLIALNNVSFAGSKVESKAEVEKREKRLDEEQKKQHPERKGFLDARKKCVEAHKDEGPAKIKECMKEFLESQKK